MSNVEKITHVAIKTSGHKVYSEPKPLRHDAVIKVIYAETNRPVNGVQGFLTSSGRFLDRKEAAALALQTGQISKLSWPPLLYSEDLW